MRRVDLKKTTTVFFTLSRIVQSAKGRPEQRESECPSWRKEDPASRCRKPKTLRQGESGAAVPLAPRPAVLKIVAQANSSSTSWELGQKRTF